MKKTVAVLCLIGTGLLAVPAPRSVWAHAAMTKSSPADGAVLTASPAAIQAWFSEELAANGNTLRLLNADDKVLATGGLDAKVPKNRGLRLVPPRLGPGTYLVRWHVVSADDNAVSQGYFRFTVHALAMAPSGMGQPSLPPLKLIAPANRAALKNPVAIVVETPGDIKELTMGGMSGMPGMEHSGVHLHILVDAVANMPTSDQLTALGHHRYKYTLAPLSSGTHTIKVFWADNKTHRAMGPVQTATCTVTK